MGLGITPRDVALAEKIASLAENDLRAAFQIKQKQVRSETIDNIWTRVFTEVGVDTEDGPDAQAVKEACFALESRIVRSQILDGEPRIDGRDTRTVRPITIRTWVVTAHPRLYPVYPRRNPGARGRNIRYRSGRAKN